MVPGRKVRDCPQCTLSFYQVVAGTVAEVNMNVSLHNLNGKWLEGPGFTSHDLLFVSQGVALS